MSMTIRNAARAMDTVVAGVEATASPWLRLAVRVWVAQGILLAGVPSMIAGHGVPVSAWWPALIQQVTATSLGVAVQAACPVLLAIGLFTRPAALALVAQVTLLRVPGSTPDAALFWTALLAWLVTFGPGPISVDGLFGPGSQNSAIPGAAAAGRAARFVTERIGPAFLVGLRVWIAAAPAGLALAALGVTDAMQPGIRPWLPHVPSMVADMAPWAALLVAGLLIAGLAARPAALTLLLLVPLSELMGAGDVRLLWSLTLCVLIVHGAGWPSLDAAIGRALRRTRPSIDRDALPHVVVVGGGFGGLAAVQGLRAAACRVTLIDERNHQVFQPLLYQVATASLTPSDIATPIRSMVRDQENARVVLGEVTGVDVLGKAVLLGQSRIRYDRLVIATGARHGYFGRDDWAAVAPGLKSIEDATTIRRRLLLAFEEAENTADPDERRAWLTFIVVGGGPTGVELAGSIAELARHGLSGEFRAIDPAVARVVLVQAGDRVLPSFPESLSGEAHLELEQLGVEVQLDRKVEDVTATGATISGAFVAARTVLWAAGVMASPAAMWLGVTADRAGRVPVGPDLRVAGCEDVWAIGDTAASNAWSGKPVPGLAPAAKQGGAYVARVICAELQGSRAPGPFRYRHLGSLATVGRKAAVADFGFVRLHGAVAWWLWGVAHIAFLAGGRSRLTVLIEWVWAYLTYRRSTRLITRG